MPVMVVYRDNRVSPEAYAPYEAEMSARPLPPEALLHLVGFDGAEGMAVDVWQTRAAFEAYTRETINPLLAKHGIPITAPQVFEIEHTLANDVQRLFAATNTAARQLAEA